uniref:E3 ubiquitin-protein ligase SH3RF1-like isoform X3 n=1 Tax=Styela clava TaxID=7725 RepID=UPI00193A930E|nr:E3 ubiquitin-protein ligase SH3RF1-like isoform X3 [Styela clava]
MEDLLECNICMEPFDATEERIPKILSCQHSFCMSCLAAILKNNSICCPICRRKQKCKSVDELQNNLYVVRLLDLRKTTKQKKKCQRCLRITERCENCSDHSLCSNCSSIDMSKRMEDIEKSVQKDYSVGVNKLLQVVAVILNFMILIYLIHWLKENATYHWMITLFFLLICCAPTKTHIEDRQTPLEVRRANIVRRRRRY